MTIVDHIHPYSIILNHPQPCQPWLMIFNHGYSWPCLTMAIHPNNIVKQSHTCLNMVTHSPPLSNMVSHGKPLSTIINHDHPWSTIFKYQWLFFSITLSILLLLLLLLLFLLLEWFHSPRPNWLLAQPHSKWLIYDIRWISIPQVFNLVYVNQHISTTL